MSRVSGPRGIRLELPALHEFNAVGRLVVGGVAARLDFEVADIEDLQLAVEAVLCRAPAAGTITLALTPSEDGLDAELGPFLVDGDRDRVERMLRRLVTEAVVEDVSEGQWVVLRVRQRAAAAARRSS